MARPTDDLKESKIILRINAETREKLEKEAEKAKISLSQHIRNIISGEKEENSVLQNQNYEDGLSKWGINEEYLADLSTMAGFMGGSVGEMIRLLDEAVNEGAITYEGGKYIGVPEYDLSNLEEACHERGIGMQEAIDKTVKNLRSGK